MYNNENFLFSLSIPEYSLEYSKKVFKGNYLIQGR